jgi:PKD repeat protein
MLRRVLSASVAAAFVGLGAFAAGASADSLVYLKGGEIWISHVDGSAARPVTSTPNNWAWPSEADNGMIVAAGGLARNFSDGSDTSGSSEIYKLNQSGAQIGNTTDPPGSHSMPACDEFAPQHVRVSPDGTKAAYDFFLCTGDETTVWANLSDVSYRPPPPQQIGQEDYYAPSWFNNSTFLVTHDGPPITDNGSQFFVHTLSDADFGGSGLGGDQNIDQPSYQVVAARTGNRMAVFEADSASGRPGVAKIVLYTTDGNPGDPYFESGTAAHGDTPMCKLTLPASAITNANAASPTFSYDGSELAWTENDGIHVANVTNLNTGPDVENVPECTTVSQRLLIPGGSMPFFGHGDESSAPSPPPPPSAPKPVAAFSVSPKHPRHGKSISFNASASHESGGKLVSYRWSVAGKKASGRVIKHVFKRRGRYTVTLTVTDAGGHTAKLTKTIIVK